MSKIEPTTIEAIKLNLDGIKKISKDRVLSELFKILRVKNFVKLNKNNVYHNRNEKQWKREQFNLQ